MDTNYQIKLENICKSYGKHEVLKDINLKIPQGDFLCIFGKSGGGKSTLLNIIGALETYEKGNMTAFNVENPVNKKKSALYLRREKIAYLFQSFALVEKMTVLENMMLAAKYSKVKDKNVAIHDALVKMGISDKIKSKIYELSGGEQQRVAMARNMIKPCELILADEPTGSLDKTNKELVMNTLQEENERGKTVVVVSHDYDFTKIAKRSLRVEEGRLNPI